ncbi:MAG TPA: presqualene diphosphate synthase HpnD [Solirubrobacteraceae bacterium]|nr:presqualene diphosphate synthase HpnD [Solirubrobacteraceae bacterium]
MSATTLSPGGPATAEALRHCAAVTRREAANFYYGIRLLPRAKFDALCAIYAFARAVDDIGDGSLGEQQKVADLARARSAIETMDKASADPVIVALASVEHHFALPRDAFTDLIDGVQMDITGVSYETFDELVVYCRRVAGSIGRLCLAVFGSRDPAADSLADDLGVALQLTNILRDVREDALNGRVYLPADDLRRFGWPREAGGDAAAIAALSPGEPGTLAALVHFEVERNREWFARGKRLIALLDRRSGACALAMSQIYEGVLERIDARPERILEGRVSLPAVAKTRLALRSLLWRGT